MKQVMVFIDGSNLYHGLKTWAKRTDIDIGELAKVLCGADRELVRTYYYNAPVSQDDQSYKGQQRFLDALHRVPDLEVVLGRLEKRPDGRLTEKGVDVNLSVDMLSKAYRGHYDVAILVSGDGDFSRVVKEVKDAGRKIEVAYFPKAYHLMVNADKFIILDSSLLSKCWLDKKAR